MSQPAQARGSPRQPAVGSSALREGAAGSFAGRPKPLRVCPLGSPAAAPHHPFDRHTGDVV